MREQIFKLIADCPKHFSKIIKKDEKMLKWVLDHKQVVSSIFAEEIYSALHLQNNVCSNGNTRKFKSINEGYVGCGPAAKCKCVAERVSTSVSKSKQLYSIEQQDAITRKKQQTNLQRYGHINVAQTDSVKKKHAEWYANPDNVEKMLLKIRQTNIEKYGVENCKTLPEVEQKIIATCLARYGVENVSQIPSTKAKLRARTAEYKLLGVYLKLGYTKVAKYIKENYNFELLTPIDDYQGVESNDLLKLQCIECNTIVESKFYYGRGLTCKVCNPPSLPSYISKEEQEVFDFITQELKISGRQSVKDIITPFELDMVFDEYNIAIEYCGLYWHSEFSSNKDKNYHFNKMVAANSKGYRLITIFSDEWNLTKNIVKSKLTNIFKKTSTRFYARKLSVKEVPVSDSRKFQDSYHLQGYSNAKINLGLYNDNELVALMTFSNGRAALNTAVVESEYELVRFLTNGASIVGGASKLLKHFINTYNPTKITSYADNRWSEGNLYLTLGFSKEVKPTVGYWYVEKYQVRHHRYNFRKSALIDAGNLPELSEWEIMKNLGYDRIWDCGHTKFTLIL